jgi:hypothetical protein
MKKIFTLLAVMLTLSFAASAQGLVINEVDYDQPSLDSAEFIEIYNGGSSAVDLSDYVVLLYNGSSTSLSVYDTIALPAQFLNPGDYFVICGNTGKVPNCDLALNQATNIIQNGSPDAIALYSVPSLSYEDVISYEGDCPAPYVEGTGLPLAQSDTVVVDSINGRYISVGRYPNGQDSNNNSLDFVRACITPGAANLNTEANCAQVSGISRPVQQFSLVMYPNPSRGQVSIDFGKDGSNNAAITVYDILGNQLRQLDAKVYNSIYHLDLSDLVNGVYFVKVNTTAGESMQRILLKK